MHVPNVETGRKPFKARRVAAGAAHRPRWYGVGEALSAKGYVLRDPMVYVCDERPDEYEASCIDLSLAVGKPVRQVVCSVDSCLSYEGLSPGRRAIYLSWISSGRTGALTDIGYAYLFFYGLERRLIVDRQDSSPIFNECVRLLQTYAFSTSFDSDIGRFLAFAQARSGLATLDHQWFQAVSEKSRLTQHEDFLAVALACFHQKNVPLPTSWAMAIARRDPRSPEGAIPERLPDKLQALFECRYREKLGDGIELRASKRNRTLAYRPANPSLGMDRSAGRGRPRCRDRQRPRHPEPVHAAGGPLGKLPRRPSAGEPGPGQTDRSRRDDPIRAATGTAQPYHARRRASQRTPRRNRASHQNAGQGDARSLPFRRSRAAHRIAGQRLSS